jgi:hypothetical protein
MACSFTPEHYLDLIEAAKAGGYRFALFEQEPTPGDLFLRHDVDLSLDAAIQLAELEASLDARSTYFLMTRSVFYNLLSEEGERTIDRLRELGHRVGLHAVYPHLDIDGRFERLVAWHNPDPAFMQSELEGLTNVMSFRFFDPAHYRSDSNRLWRHGCPHEALAAGEFEWLQLLTHPALWIYPGDTMREAMLAMLEAEHALDLERLAQDRIDLS